ncbi:NAD(P)H-dependent oxidoreductase [Lactobacillus selangorensis]|nr:NAD(P)H-dependent oxidoreductase [Lactobacillus selangorensis]
MQTLVVVAHPERVQSGTQEFLQASAAPFKTVQWHELEAPFEKEAEQRQLLTADRLILQFPLYWYSAPAMLYQWLDDVWTEKFAVRAGNLNGKQLGIVVTTGVADQAYHAGEREGFTLDEILRPFQALAHKTGMTYLPLFPITQFGYQTDAQKQRLLVAYQRYLTEPYPRHFADTEKWFAEQLAQLAADHPDYQLLLDQFTKNADELEQLNDTLQMMRQNEEND